MKENTHAQTKIDAACAALAPYITALTPAERHELPKMGQKTLGFVEKAYDFAQQNPNLVPPYLTMADFGIDFTDAVQCRLRHCIGLWTLLNSVQQLEQAIGDTEMAAGSKAYRAALVFYKSVKIAAAQSETAERCSGVSAVPGAKAVYDELKTRFPGGRRKSGSSETETETVTETVKKKVEVS